MVVSIIMSAYNAGKTIKKAIKSCQNQSLKDFELIIVNDCSTDNTEKIVLKELKKDNRIKYVRNECNLGAGMSRRNGIKHIQGDYSCFLDSDDYLEPDYLQTLYDAAIKYDSDLVCTGVIGVYKNKKI